MHNVTKNQLEHLKSVLFCGKICMQIKKQKMDKIKQAYKSQK